MLEAMTAALARLAALDAVSTILIGTMIGVTFGALPGLGSVIALALVLPFTFGMDPMLAMLLYAGIMSSVTFGGSVPAILLNTPGTPPNAATCFDGYPMARRGEGARALAISSASCFAGSLGGVIVTLALLPVVKPIVYAFGPPEFFWLVAFGMVMIAFAARGNMIKGLAGGGIGIMISLVGYDDMTGSFRFTYGSDYLWDGLPLVTFVTGLFAISELIAYASRGGSTVADSVDMAGVKWTRQVAQGVRDVAIRPAQTMRAAAIGAGVGIIPGLGGGVASFMSYIIGMQRSRDESYGKGSPEGIIASETANDAKDGGALLPTVAFGIPGSPDTAILLGAFILHGLQPGPTLLREHMDIVCLLLFGIFVSQIATSAFGLVSSPLLARISVIRSRWLAPFVLSLVVVGTFMLNQNILDSGAAVLVGIMGYVLRRFGFPLITIAIGFILGPLLETSFLQSMLISQSGFGVFWSSPIALVLMVCTLSALFGPFIADAVRRTRRGDPSKKAQNNTAGRVGR
ncbi:tripartite tricarboxylate transporter permease [Pseudoruegeria sp. HB172150]|uniref:tripartite tricarboxylate transporter permease n=1 Tax=Pseudoruegeria sp. HB172150 TaxID=2721164 RepID=UPI0015519B37|nr:tripartite tricarboxylate transporter permease [Pseudoruegeria sp. HB172150]